MSIAAPTLYVPFLATYAVAESCVRYLSDSFSGSLKTDVKYQPTLANAKIIKQLDVLFNFKAPFWARGPISQLFCAILCPAATIEYIPEVLTLADGGHVILDWSTPNWNLPQAPVLIILHGIAGGSKEPYMRRMVHAATSRGWVAVVYNRRGHRNKDGVRENVQASVDAELGELACEVGGPPSKPWPASAASSPVDTPTSRSTPASPQIPAGKAGMQRRVWPMYSDLEDMHEVVQHVRSKAKGRVYAVGFSAGSNCLTKYVGETGGACPLTGAVSVANGYDLQSCLQYVQKNAWMMERIIAHNLKRLFRQCSSEIESHGHKIGKSELRRCRSVRDIDTVVTARLYQVDLDSYYTSQSCISNVADTRIPLLCLNAQDDPLIDPALVGMGHKFAQQNHNSSFNFDVSRWAPGVDHGVEAAVDVWCCHGILPGSGGSSFWKVGAEEGWVRKERQEAAEEEVFMKHLHLQRAQNLAQHSSAL